MSRMLRVIPLIVALAVVTPQSPIPALAAVTVSGDTDISSFEIQAGINGLGTLRIDAGSTQTTGSLRLGTQQFGVGLATVTGAGSQLILNNSNFTEIGQSGLGRLEILNGGFVNMTSSSGSMRIGSGSGCCGGSSHGTVIVDGPGSLLTIGNDLIVGSNGTGTLQIQNGAIVSAVQSQTQVNAASRIEMNGGLLRINQLTNDGVVRGSGEISLGQISGTGRFEARSGQTLRITGGNSFSNTGIIAADGGEIELISQVTNSTNGSSAGEITLRNGTIRVGQVGFGGPDLQNSAVLAAIGGTNDFYGNILNVTSGSIAVTNNSVLIFHDDVDADDGTITVFPGSSAVFLEDLTMTGSSVLLADLAGSGADSGFGEIEVVGNAQLNASLNITLADGFTPEEGDTFPIVAASTVIGTLALGDVAELPSGLMWDLEHETNRVVLSVVPGLAGDYNKDGAVDSADYIVWRKTFGQKGDDLAADGNSNGEVDDGDYDFWFARLGNMLMGSGGGGSNGASVPEPTTFALLFLASVLVSCNRWKLN